MAKTTKRTKHKTNGKGKPNGTGKRAAKPRFSLSAS